MKEEPEEPEEPSHLSMASSCENGDLTQPTTAGRSTDRSGRARREQLPFARDSRTFSSSLPVRSAAFRHSFIVHSKRCDWSPRCVSFPVAVCVCLCVLTPPLLFAPTTLPALASPTFSLCAHKPKQQHSRSLLNELSSSASIVRINFCTYNRQRSICN